MPGGIRLKLGIIIRPCYRDDKKPGFPICIYTKRKPRIVLGRHRSKSSALRQESRMKNLDKPRKKAR